jgi:hypothetical protein
MGRYEMVLGQKEKRLLMTDNQMTLLPCPFREHKRKKLVIHHRKHRCYEDGLYAVKCEICGIRGPYALSEEKAVEKWNTRHVETCENMREKFGYKRLFVCSECGVTFDPDCEINYCPWCGRKVVDNAD